MHESFGRVYARLTATALEEIADRLQPPATIVDFGAGCGRLAVPLAQRGYRVTAVEPSDAMRAELTKASATLPVDVVAGDLRDFEPPRRHDLALCVFTVLAYLLEQEELEAALASVARSLRLGGLFLLDIPAAEVFQDLEAQTGVMIRDLSIEPLAHGRYAYRERTTLRTEAGPITFEDAFQLRRWTESEVRNALERAGFEEVADVASRFRDLGATYLLMRLAVDPSGDARLAPD